MVWMIFLKEICDNWIPFDFVFLCRPILNAVRKSLDPVYPTQYLCRRIESNWRPSIPIEV